MDSFKSEHKRLLSLNPRFAIVTGAWYTKDKDIVGGGVGVGGDDDDGGSCVAGFVNFIA